MYFKPEKGAVCGMSALPNLELYIIVNGKTTKKILSCVIPWLM